MGRSDDSITNIAAAVGYSDFSTFERAFKEFTGVCPREYRRKVWIAKDHAA